MFGALRCVHCPLVLFLLLLRPALGYAADDRPPDEANRGSSTTETTGGAPKSHPLSAQSQCEARTINYITHGLPQFCLTSAWSSPTATLNATSLGAPHHATGTTSTSTSAQVADADASSAQSAEAPGGSEEPGAGRFMSFEDWKELMLKQSGQDPQDLRIQRKGAEQPVGERGTPELANSVLGEEGEVNLSFGTIMDGQPREKPTETSQEIGHDNQDELVLAQDGRPFIHRSTDAGKTGKERFSYASFDAGATVLKTGKATKNAKAILVENKDTYMLLECATQNNFVIVELSDDILVDTIVLANFEFFSSMVRHFRVSVSDRYPLKMEKWRTLGTFEARNSRDIQPFLVENPQIWAKYLRIEFLSNYGNEFYCPISLLRVHGSRMLDSWKESETGTEEDSHEVGDDVPQALPSEDQSTEVKEGEASHSHELLRKQDLAEAGLCLLSSHPLFILPHEKSMCDAYVPGINETLQKIQSEPSITHSAVHEDGPVDSHNTEKNTKTHQAPDLGDKVAMPSSLTSPNPTKIGPRMNHTSTASDDHVSASRDSPASTQSQTEGSSGPMATSTIKSPSSASSGGRSRSMTPTGPSVASPTVQEGFFNAITKRLHQVESNLTLSLKYTEDQSRQLQDALRTAEQKHATTVSRFLENLNQTVLAELRSVRDQYDQIWQSTIIALDTQREQSQRDIVALSTRLNLLADEVVFQKRMAIVQAVLLLSCLSLVLFSRGVSISSMNVPLDPSSASPYSSPSSSPRYRRGRNTLLSLAGTDLAEDSGPQVRRNGLETQFGIDGRVASSDREYVQSVQFPSAPIAQAETPVEYERLSPPLSQASSGDITSIDAVATRYENPMVSLRRETVRQQSTAKKPLPALPEVPAFP